MQGSNQGQNYGSSDWVNKASPNDLITAGTAIFSKIAQADTSTRDQFVQKLRNDPNAARLLESVGTTA